MAHVVTSINRYGKMMVLFGLFGFPGCYVIPCGWSIGYKQLTKEPSRQSIVGNYKLSSESTQYLKARGFGDNQFLLSLKYDGTFEMKAPDIILNSWGTSNHLSEKKTGKWSVTCIGSEGCLIELERVCVTEIASKNETLAIPISIGDPDECNGIIYEKISN